MNFAEQCLRLYSDQKLWEDISQQGLSVSANDCSETNFQEAIKIYLQLKRSS